MSQFLTVPTIGASQMPQKVALPYASLLLERREGRVAFVPNEAMPDGTAPSDAEIQRYYRDHLARYTVPERRVVRYARVTPDKVAAQAQASDAEIAQAYNAARATYAPSEQRTLTQVTVLDPAAATRLAQSVKAGATIATAAQAAGLEASTLAAVDKAAYARQTSTAAADTVFAAAEGAVVGPVAGTIGSLVVHVDTVRQVPGKTLAEARDEIAATLREQKTAEALANIQDSLDEAIGESASFNELAQDQKLTAQVTPPLLAGALNPADPAAAPDPALVPIVTAGFAAEEGDTATLVPTGQNGSFAVVALDRIVRAAPRPLTEVRDRVAADVRTERAQRRAQSIAAAVLKKVRAGTALDAAVRAAGVPLPPVRELKGTRAEFAGNQQGLDPALALMFSMAKGTARMIAAPNGSGWLVFRLDQTVESDARKTPSLIEATRGDLGRVIGREYVEQFAQAVRAQQGVSRNAAALASVKAELTGQDTPNP